MRQPPGSSVLINHAVGVFCCTKRRLGTSPLSDLMVRTVYMGIRPLDSTTGELYELPQLLKRCVLRLRGVSRALISQGVAGRKRCVENAGSGRLPHGCNLVPRQMDNGHTFTALILSTSDRAKPSASSWNAGISILIIAITHDARWEGA